MCHPQIGTIIFTPTSSFLMSFLPVLLDLVSLFLLSCWDHLLYVSWLSYPYRINLINFISVSSFPIHCTHSSWLNAQGIRRWHLCLPQENLFISGYSLYLKYPCQNLFSYFKVGNNTHEVKLRNCREKLLLNQNPTSSRYLFLGIIGLSTSLWGHVSPFHSSLTSFVHEEQVAECNYYTESKWMST